MHKVEMRRRVELGFSRKEAAELCGVSEDVLRRIENGRNPHKINLDTAQAIANGLDCPLHTLFDDMELSNVGRAGGKGGTPLKRHGKVIYGSICPTHNVEMSLTNVCDSCHS